MTKGQFVKKNLTIFLTISRWMRHLRNIYGPDLPAPLYKARARNVTQSSDWDWPTPYVAVICCSSRRCCYCYSGIRFCVCFIIIITSFAVSQFRWHLSMYLYIKSFAIGLVQQVCNAAHRKTVEGTQIDTLCQVRNNIIINIIISK